MFYLVSYGLILEKNMKINEKLLEPTILYDGGATGTNESFELKDSWKNYKYK